MLANARSPFPLRYLGVGLISMSVLALEVIFTRIFSIMIWYHFAYLVIGVALLGGGAAGTYLAIRQWGAEEIARRLGQLAIAFSLAILLNLLVISQVRVDPLVTSMAGILRALVGLAIYFASVFAVFFLGGLTTTGAFILWAQDVHRLYFADLLGASLGMLAVK